MAQGRLIGTPIPKVSAGSHRIVYLPEPVYLEENKTLVVPSTQAIATVLPKPGDLFEAYVFSSPADRRSGIVGSTGDRSVLTAVDWLLDATGGELGLAALNLSRDGEVIWAQFDGMPGPLTITAEEFDDIRAAWKRRGLPPDVYYPAREERVVVEPTLGHGGVFLFEQHYSPLRWARREAAAPSNLTIPSEDERKHRFRAAQAGFVQAILLRIAELSEPGREGASEEKQALGRLLVEIRGACKD